jgi:hypothetical protein
MRALLLLAEREIVDKRAVLAAALGAGVVALLTPLLPGVFQGSATDARNAMALILAATFAVAVALMYGASCIARDLRERRLSFYFSRPLPAASLWAGKMLAGLLLTFGSAALVVAPAALVGGPRVVAWLAEPESLWLLGVVLGLLVLAHAVAVMLSSRSAWLALDLVALVAIGAGTAVLLRMIWVTGSALVLVLAIAAFGGALLAALVAAGLVQVAAGRTDLRRGHRALSLTLWSTLALATAALAAYTAFLLHPTPRSLFTFADLTPSARGVTLTVTGESRWRGDCEPTFAVDTTSGRWVRLSVSTASWRQGWQPPVLSADGTRAVWLEALGRPGRTPVQVMTTDLSHPGARPEATTILLPAEGSRTFTVSDDGRLIALANGGLLAVHELAGGRLLASARIPKGAARLSFVADGRLRVETTDYGRDTNAGYSSVISALDLTTGRLTETGRIESAGAGAWALRVDPAWRSMLMLERSGAETALILRDAWTGRRVAELIRRSRQDAPNETNWFTATALLGDGTVVVGEVDREGARLRRFTAGGSPSGTIELGNWKRIRPGAEVSPGRLAVALAASSWEESGQRTVWNECALVDVATGASTVVARHAWPATPYLWRLGDHCPEPGSLAARLFFVEKLGLALWEPDGGGHMRSLINAADVR